jgi:hypothetical protein
MSNIVFNVAKGRVTEYYNRVKSADPANSAFILVPLATAAADATLLDQLTLAAVLAGGSTEQATMGRKTLAAAALAAFPGPDTTNDRYDVALPTTTWTAATGAAIVKILVCYDNDTTAGTDANIVPLCCFDFAQTPSGADIQMTTGPFYRAS